MANPHRGEVALSLDGTEHTMRLSLNALVELEQVLGEQSLLALVERFEENRFSAADLITLLAAGLRGGGWEGDRDLLGKSKIEGGVLQAAKTAGELLKVTFGPANA